MAKRKEKKIDWKPGESYSAARSRWWNSMTPAEKLEALRDANALGEKVRARMLASRRKSAA